MRATVVILTKLPGHLPVKTRLVPLLGVDGAREAYRTMLDCSVALARTLDPRPTLATSPRDADPQAALPGLRDVTWRPVDGDDGATCLERALAAAWDGERPLVALGGDAPDLPARLLRRAVELLARCHAAFVPTPDGGFSALALRAPVPGLAAGFAYGGMDSLRALRSFLAGRGASVAWTEPWPDVDTPADWRAWRRRAADRGGSSPASESL